MEIAVCVPFLKPGAFLVAGRYNLSNRLGPPPLGSLLAEAFDKVFGGLLRSRGHFREE